MTKVSALQADRQSDDAARAADTPSPPAFDYGSEAELFPTRPGKGRRQTLTFRRFARAADAVQFAVEKLPAAALNGTCLEVDEQRYAGNAIRRLYDSADYPLARPSPRQ